MDETWTRLSSGRTIEINLCPANKIAETLLYIARMNGTAITSWSVKQQSYFDRKSETWVNNTYYSRKTKCTVIATFVMTQEEKFNLVGKTIIPPKAYGMNKQKHQVNILPLLGSWHGDVKTNQGSFFIAGLPKNISLNDHMFRIAEIIWKETHGEIEKKQVTFSDRLSRVRIRRSFLPSFWSNNLNPVLSEIKFPN